MVDFCGCWPTWATIVEEAKKRANHIWEFFTGIGKSVFNSIEAEIGVGVGYGGSGNVSVGGVNATVSAEKTLNDSLVFDNGRFYARFTETTSLGLMFFDRLGFKPTIESSHSFNDVNCTCNPWDSTYGEQRVCPANVTESNIAIVDNKVGLSFELYIAIGAKASFYINIDELLAGFKKVYQNALAY
jgi:hypothetical protein